MMGKEKGERERERLVVHSSVVCPPFAVIVTVFSIHCLVVCTFHY